MTRSQCVTLAALAAALSVPAAAGVTVIGSSPGRPCYEAAKARSSSGTSLAMCDEALASDMLVGHDVVATHVNRGIVRLWRNDHQGAIEDFDAAIDLDPSEPESYLNKASTIVRMGGDTAEAVALFDQSIKRQTKVPELAYFGRAIAHEVSGNLKAAYNDYRRAQSLAPKWEQPRRELSRFKVKRTGSSSL
jgi:tetratricopeptide (TPR) repeat protein